MSRQISDRQSQKRHQAAARVAYAVRISGLSQSDLEDQLGLSAGYLSKILHCKRSLSPEVAARLAAVSGVSEAWLLTGEGDNIMAAEAPAMYGASVAEVRVLPITVCARCQGRVYPGAVVCRHCNARLIWPEKALND